MLSYVWCGLLGRKYFQTQKVEKIIGKIVVCNTFLRLVWSAGEGIFPNTKSGENHR